MQVPRLEISVSKSLDDTRRIALSPIRANRSRTPFSSKSTETPQISPTPLVPLNSLGSPPRKQPKKKKSKPKDNFHSQQGPVGLASHPNVKIHFHISTPLLSFENKTLSLQVPEKSAAYRSGERRWDFQVNTITENEANLSVVLQEVAKNFISDGKHLAWLVGSEDIDRSTQFIFNFFSHLFIQVQGTIELSLGYVQGDNLYDGMTFCTQSTDKKFKPKKLKLTQKKDKSTHVVGLQVSVVSSIRDIQSLFRNCEKHVTKPHHRVLLATVRTSKGNADLQVWQLQWPERGIHVDRSMCSLMDCIRVMQENTCRKKPLIVPFRNSTMTRLLHSYLTRSNSNIITQINLSSTKYKTLVQTLSFCCEKSTLSGLSTTKDKFSLMKRQFRRAKMLQSKKQKRALGPNVLETISNDNRKNKANISSLKTQVEEIRQECFKKIEEVKLEQTRQIENISPLVIRKQRTIYRDDISDHSHSSTASSYRSNRSTSCRKTPEYDNLRSILESTRRSLGSRETEIRKLRSQLQTKSKTIHELNEAIRDVSTSKSATVERKESTIALMQRKITGLEKELNEMTSKHKVREDEVADLMLQSKRVIEVLVEELNVLGESSQTQAIVPIGDLNEFNKDTESSVELWSKIKTSLVAASLQANGKNIKGESQKVIQSLYNAMNILLKTIQLGQQEKKVLTAHTKNLEQKVAGFQENFQQKENQVKSLESKIEKISQASRNKIDQLLVENSEFKGMLQTMKASCKLIDSKVDISSGSDNSIESFRKQVARNIDCLQGAAAELIHARSRNRNSAVSTPALRELEGFLEESESKRRRLKVDHEKLKAKLKLVDQRRMSLEEETERLSLELKNSSEISDQLEKSLKDGEILRRESEMKDGLISELDKHILELENKEEMKEGILLLHSQLMGLKKDLSQTREAALSFNMKPEVEAVMNVMKNSKVRVHSLREMVAKCLDLKVDGSHHGVEALHAEVQLLCELFNATQRSSEKIDSEFKSVKSENESLKKNLSDVLTHSNAELKELQSKLASSEGRISEVRLEWEAKAENSKIQGQLKAQSLEMKLNEARIQIEQEKAKVAELNCELENSRKEFVSKHEHDEKMLLELEKWVEQLQNEVQKKKDELDTVNSKHAASIAELENDLSCLENEMRKKVEQAGIHELELEEKIDDINSQLKFTKEDLQAKSSLLEQTTKMKNSMESIADELEKESTNRDEKVKELKKEIIRVTKKCEAEKLHLKQTISELEDLIKKKEEESRKARERHVLSSREHSAEISRLEGIIAQKGDQIESLNRVIENGVKENQKLQNANFKLQSDISIARSSMMELEKEKAIALKQIESVELENASIERKSIALQDNIFSLEEEISKNQVEFEYVKLQARTSLAEISSKQDLADAFREDIISLEQQLAESEKQNEKLLAQYNEILNEKEALEADLEDTREEQIEADAALREVMTEKANLLMNVEELKNKINELNNQIEEKENVEKEATSIISQKDEELETLTDALESKSQEADVMIKVNQQLTLEIQKLNRELKGVSSTLDNSEAQKKQVDYQLSQKDQLICELEKIIRMEKSISSQVCFEMEQSFMREQNLKRKMDELLQQKNHIEEKLQDAPKIVVQKEESLEFIETIVPVRLDEFPIVEFVRNVIESEQIGSDYSRTLEDIFHKILDNLCDANLRMEAQDMLLTEYEASIEDLQGQLNERGAELSGMDEEIIFLRNQNAELLDVEEEVQLLSDFLCKNGLGDAFFEHYSPDVVVQGNQESDEFSSEEPLAYSRMQEAFCQCVRIEETDEENPLECEVDCLSRIYDLEQALKTKEEEVTKWKAWKERADSHGKQLAENLLDRERGVKEFQMQLQAKEDEIDCLNQQIQCLKEESEDNKKLLLESNKKFESVEKLIDQEFQTLRKSSVSQDKLETLFEKNKENESQLMSSMQNLFEESSKENNIWAIRSISRICKQIDTIMAKASIKAADIEVSSAPTLVDAIEMLQHRVNRIQEAKTKYMSKQKTSKKRRHRHYLRGSPNANQPSKDLQNDQQCLIS